MPKCSFCQDTVADDKCFQIAPIDKSDIFRYICHTCMADVEKHFESGEADKENLSSDPVPNLIKNAGEVVAGFYGLDMFCSPNGGRNIVPIKNVRVESVDVSHQKMHKRMYNIHHIDQYYANFPYGNLSNPIESDMEINARIRVFGNAQDILLRSP